MIWENAEFIAAIFGGLLVGLSCTLIYLMFGRIVNMSGLFNNLFKFNIKGGFFWKFCFFTGLLTIPHYFYWKFGREIFYQDHKFVLFDTDSYSIKNLSLFGWILGGVLVGFGTRLGKGDTIGHSVCGIPSGYLRSMIATFIFISTAIGISTWRHTHPFMQKGNTITSAFENKLQIFTQLLAGFIAIYFILGLFKNLGTRVFKEYFLTYLCGCIFGTGLLISGMCRPSKFYNFLTFDHKEWDPSLLLMLCTAIIFNLFTFPMIQIKLRPIFYEQFAPVVILQRQEMNKIDARMIIGSIIYGLGLGLTGITPATGLINFFVMSYAVFWVCGLFLGQLACRYFTHFILGPIEKKRSSEARGSEFRAMKVEMKIS